MLLLPELLSAQGREFWFAAPEVTSRHADKPIVLRIYSFNKAADITISQPANGNFTVIKDHIPANSFKTIDITSQIDQIETKPSNQVLNTGLLVQATSDVNAYYEVIGRPGGLTANNSEIFVLKGNNALGTLFYVPMQTESNNQAQNNLDAWASFDIVATENNTIVKITPNRNLLGHNKGETFNIVLNKGQTFSSRALSTQGSERPAGSKIESDKPIAVTYKDDSILKDVNYWDLIGDQILPVSELGTEYIAIRNSGYILPNSDSDSDIVYVVATKNQTEIVINEDTVVLNEGETYKYRFYIKEIDGTNDTVKTASIHSSEKIYVLHVSGFFNELGAANLLPLNCTGSKQTIFVRTNSEFFSINILVKSGGEGNFKLNGASSSIINASFKDVPETNGSWKYARIPLGTSAIGINIPYTLTNSTHNFHLCVLNGGILTSFKYGYFSGFANLNLGPDKFLCPDKSIVLDAGLNKDSYEIQKRTPY